MQVGVLAQQENFLLVPDYWTGLFLGPERYCNAEDILRRISLASSKFRTKTKAIQKYCSKYRVQLNSIKTHHRLVADDLLIRSGKNFKQ